MNEERLWAPWRLQYVSGQESVAQPEPIAWHDGADAECFLCRAAAQFEPATEAAAYRQLLVAFRGPHAMVVLNRYPYSNGHVLVAPRRHVAELSDMSDEEHLACVGLMTQLTVVMREHLRAEGFNIGLNLGRAAGAGVPGHLHWHVVPRWTGDNNFMPVLAGTRVIPQSLEEVWELLAGVLV